MKKDVEYYLSKYEIWFLISQYPFISIIGFKNPVEGYLIEDLFPLIQEASFSLLDKGFIYIDQDHKIKLNEDIKRLLEVIATAEHTLLIAYKIGLDKKEIIRSFNFHGNIIVALKENDEDSYLLCEVNSKDDLVSIVIEPFLNKIFWSPDTEHFLISESNLTLVHRAMEKSYLDEAKTLLDKANGDKQSKTDFFETLQSPSVRFSLLEFKRWKDPQKNQINGFSVLTDERYIWFLELVDLIEKSVKVSKITIKELKKKIFSITSSMLRE
jgi:hypothetical protein